MASAFITVASMPMLSAWLRSMPLAAPEHAAEDVAAADHEADLDAHLEHVHDVGGDPRHRVVVEAVFALAHQGLARHLQQDAPRSRLLDHEFSSVRGEPPAF